MEVSYSSGITSLNSSTNFCYYSTVERYVNPFYSSPTEATAEVAGGEVSVARKLSDEVSRVSVDCEMTKFLSPDSHSALFS